MQGKVQNSSTIAFVFLFQYSHFQTIEPSARSGQCFSHQVSNDSTTFTLFTQAFPSLIFFEVQTRPRGFFRHIAGNTLGASLIYHVLSPFKFLSSKGPRNNCHDFLLQIPQSPISTSPFFIMPYNNAPISPPEEITGSSSLPRMPRHPSWVSYQLTLFSRAGQEDHCDG